jgi:4-hydroxybenzoate polyprenyltransferase
MSALELIAVYIRQRARFRLFVPLSILLAFAGRWLVAPSSASAGAVAIAASQALALTFAFRIWDDLEDRDADRDRHRDRVLTITPRIAPVYLLGFALFSACLVPLVSETFAVRRLAALSLAAAVLSIWYGVRSRETHHVLAEHVLAVKYPLIAYAVAPELPAEILTPRIAVVLIVLYLIICVYEYAEDVELRQIFTSRRSVP